MIPWGDLDQTTIFNFPCARKGGVDYYNIPASFDIETTNTFKTCGKSPDYCYNTCSNFSNCDIWEKQAFMYIWQFGINGICVYGRTWDEFEEFINILADTLELSENKRLIVYVHNLSFEFQFIRKHFKWLKVFALKEREPVQAITDRGVEFRCSYKLSGYSLEKIGEQLRTYKVQKLVGNLDYNKIRGSWTPLTEPELDYCANDIKVVMAYIQEKIEADGDITKIPLTKTGYVRQYCKQKCFENRKYHKIIKNLTLEADEYKQLKRAFQGGYTHANAFYSGTTLHDVHSFDLTSSYPTVMVAERFPMSASVHIEYPSAQEFFEAIQNNCCIFDCLFVNIRPRILIEDYISISRCSNVINPIINNGRLVQAEQIVTTLTEQDFFIINRFYLWDDLKVRDLRVYKRGYLPKEFVLSILELYRDKTQLKDVAGKEVEYGQAKERINAAYGMTVTDIVRPDIPYKDDWEPLIIPNLEEAIDKYNKGRGRFLFYPWGVWVTAYARRNLWSAISEYGNDYIYSDTDSIKGVNREKHAQYIQKYNDIITSKLIRALEFHDIPLDYIQPKTITGEVKPLGIWNDEGDYIRFKTLGAKRYMTEKDDKTGGTKLSITVSGVNKKLATPWLEKTYGKDGAFKAFADGLSIPPEATGKLTHTYIDNPTNGGVIDYMGTYGEFSELSSVHLWEQDYNLSLSERYVSYLHTLSITNSVRTENTKGDK